MGHFKIDYVTGFCPDEEYEVYKENYFAQHITVDSDDDEINYKVKKINKGHSDSEEINSFDFKVKDKILYFYLTERPNK